MSDDGDFLRRWSRRKTAVRTGAAVPEEPREAKPPQAQPPAPAEAQDAPAALPPPESLSFDSDFSQFMKPEVDPGARREALKVLLRDPRFNVMDGLDVYIDDYSKPDPLPPEWLAQMNQMKHLGHYVEKVLESIEPEHAQTAGELQNTMVEQPVAPTPEATPPDTSSGDPTPSQ